MDKETFKYFPPVIDRDAQGRITLHLCDDDYMRFIDMVNYFDYFRPRIFGPPTDFSTEKAKQEVADLTDDAIAILQELPYENPFLTELLRWMVLRDK